MFDTEQETEVKVFETYQSWLEHSYIEEYLEMKGRRWKDLCQLPEMIAKQLMIEACRYATLKLAELEARAGLRNEIHTDWG